MFFEVLAHFNGTVQGVGFRYRVKRILAGEPVQGYVRNLSDGRVQLCLQGEEEVLREVLARIQARLALLIQEVETHWHQPQERFHGFEILR